MKKSKIRAKLKKVQEILDPRVLAEEGFKEFKRITPKDTGYARDHTKLRGTIIDAAYPYATILNKGRHDTPKGMRGSLQAPEGMIMPTIEHLREFVRKELGVSM